MIYGFKCLQNAFYNILSFYMDKRYLLNIWKNKMKNSEPEYCDWKVFNTTVETKTQFRFWYLFVWATSPVLNLLDKSAVKHHWKATNFVHLTIINICVNPKLLYMACMFRELKQGCTSITGALRLLNTRAKNHLRGEDRWN